MEQIDGSLVSNAKTYVFSRGFANGFMVADLCPFYRETAPGCLHRFSLWADHCQKSKHGTIHDHNTYCPT